MPRGGAKPGAGRKPRVDPIVRRLELRLTQREDSLLTALELRDRVTGQTVLLRALESYAAATAETGEPATGKRRAVVA